MSEGEIGSVEPETLRASPKYRAWKRNVERSGCVVRKVEVMQECRKRDGSLLFAFLRTKVEDPQGRPLPAYALIRGHACLIATVIENSETGERKFLMLRQRRIGHGGESLEFPAGMLDEDVDDPIGVAVRELKEETGLVVTRADVRPLGDKPLYSSPGLDDEAIHYYLCQVTLSPKEIAVLDGGETGQADEHEYIRLGLWNYQDALRETDSLQVKLALLLYADYMRPSDAARLGEDPAGPAVPAGP